MSEYEGAGGYLKFVIRRQPEEMQPLLQEAARLVRLEGWTNGYAIVQAWAIEIIATYGPLHPLADVRDVDVPRAETR